MIYAPYPYNPFYPGFGFDTWPYDYSLYPPYSAFPPYTSPYDLSNPYNENAPLAESGSGNVNLRVEPRDVDVYVDGVLARHGGRGTLSLPMGRWRLEFVKPGYRTETVDLDMAQGVTYRIQRRLQRLPRGEADDARAISPGDSGELQLDIQPDDAVISLDGRSLGLARDARSSETLRRLAPGRHTIEARRPGYVTLRREIVISPVQPASLHAELQRE